MSAVSETVPKVILKTNIEVACERAINGLSKLFDDRTQSEQKSIITILKQIDFFKQMQVNQTEACTVISTFLKFVEAEENILLHGLGDDCCHLTIALRGVCQKWIPVPQVYMQEVIRQVILLSKHSWRSQQFQSLHFNQEMPKIGRVKQGIADLLNKKINHITQQKEKLKCRSYIEQMAFEQGVLRRTLIQTANNVSQILQEDQYKYFVEQPKIESVGLQLEKGISRSQNKIIWETVLSPIISMAGQIQEQEQPEPVEEEFGDLADYANHLLAIRNFPNPQEHIFTLHGVQFKYTQQMYFCLVDTVQIGDSFGSQSLKFTKSSFYERYETTSPFTYATLDMQGWQKSERRIHFKRNEDQQLFLRQIPCFKYLSHHQIRRLAEKVQKIKTIRQQIIYKEGEPIKHAYIVLKGEFVLKKRLLENNQSQALAILKPFTKIKNLKTSNLLACKFPELKDFPLEHELTRYGAGTILGEEDIINNRQTYSCTLKCVTEKGVLFQVLELFIKQLQDTKRTWQHLKMQAVLKEQKKIGLHIQTKQIDLTQTYLEQIPLESQNKQNILQIQNLPIGIGQDSLCQRSLDSFYSKDSSLDQQSQRNSTKRISTALISQNSIKNPALTLPLVQNFRETVYTSNMRMITLPLQNEITEFDENILFSCVKSRNSQMNSTSQNWRLNKSQNGKLQISHTKFNNIYNQQSQARPQAHTKQSFRKLSVVIQNENSQLIPQIFERRQVKPSINKRGKSNQTQLEMKKISLLENIVFKLKMNEQKIDLETIKTAKTSVWVKDSLSRMARRASL